MSVCRSTIALTAVAALTLALGACGDDKKRTPAGDVVGDATGPGDTTATGDTAPGTDTGVAQDTTPGTDTSVAQDTGAGTDTSVAQDTTPGTDTAAPGCTRSGWAPQGTTAAGISMDEGEPAVLFLDSYSSDEGAPYDILGIELYYVFGASAAAHSFTFNGENYADCHTCVLIFADCPEEGACAKIFLAQSGTLAVTANGGAGGQFTGSLSNVTLAEVTIDSTTFTSSVVPGGETWCVPSFAFDEEIGVFRE